MNKRIKMLSIAGMERVTGRNSRSTVRKVARECYLESVMRHESPKSQIESIKRDAIKEFKKRIRKEKPFKSILASIVISIAVRLAIALITKWIEQNLFSERKLSRDYQFGEPGYIQR